MSLTDIAQTNLIAVVGQNGSLGPANGLPLFQNPGEGNDFNRWMLELTEGGVIVIGGRTFRLMHRHGFRGMGDEHEMAIWSHQTTGTTTPEAFLEGLRQNGKPIFICGGGETYKTFLPFVTQMFIRRAALSGPHEVFMPNPFGGAN